MLRFFKKIFQISIRQTKKGHPGLSLSVLIIISRYSVLAHFPPVNRNSKFPGTIFVSIYIFLLSAYSTSYHASCTITMSSLTLLVCFLIDLPLPDAAITVPSFKHFSDTSICDIMPSPVNTFL